MYFTYWPSALGEFDALILDKFSGDTPDKRLRRQVTKTAFRLFFWIVGISFGMWVLGAFKLVQFAPGTNDVLVRVFLGGFVLLVGGLLTSLWTGKASQAKAKIPALPKSGL